MGFRCLWDSAWIPEKMLLPMKYVVLQPRQEAFEIWFEYVQEGLSDSITGYRWDSKDLTRDDMIMVGSDYVEPHLGLTVFIWNMYASIVSFVKEPCILHQVFDQCICLIKLLLNSRHSQVLTGLTCIPDIYPPFNHQLSFKKQTSDISHGTQVLLPSPSPNQNQVSFEPKPSLATGSTGILGGYVDPKLQIKFPQQATPPSPNITTFVFSLFPGLRQRPPTRRRVSGIWALLFQQLRLGLSNLRSFVEGNCERCGWKKHAERKEKTGGDLRIFFFENCFLIDNYIYLYITSMDLKGVQVFLVTNLSSCWGRGCQISGKGSLSGFGSSRKI